MKISKLAYSWMEQALLLEQDEELFIPCSCKREQKSLLKEILAAIKQYSIVDSLKASRIEVVTTYKDGKLWVKLFLRSTSPLVGFKRNKDGEVSRVILRDEEARKRQIKLMIQDGIEKKTIVEQMDLTEKEEACFFGEDNKDGTK